MTDYLESLRRVQALQPLTILPGHGERVDDAGALIDEYIAHRLEREAQVLAAAQGRPAFTPMDLVPALYAAYRSRCTRSPHGQCRRTSTSWCATVESIVSAAGRRRIHRDTEHPAPECSSPPDLASDVRPDARR